MVGAVLIFAAFRFGVTASRAGEEFPPHAPVLRAVVSGAVIGLLAGLTGTGGGIFLTPLLLAAGWAGTRFAAGTSAIFILANSISGLAGNYRIGRERPECHPDLAGRGGDWAGSSAPSSAAAGSPPRGFAAALRLCCSSRA